MVHICPSTKCCCQFIPPYAAENLARNGIENARVSFQQSSQFRIQRAQSVVGIETFAGTAAAVGTANRQVFDSQRTWKQRVLSVRTEGQPATPDDTVNQVYDYAGVVRDYLKMSWIATPWTI